MLAKIKKDPTNEKLQSYLGLLSHGNTCRAREELLNEYWLWSV
ncbi:MAG TPA: hypothetical protein VJH75_03240 [Patescibacteria group bacterium]|nr:hypothetical protein [Patescibacteria group bacterium]